MYFLRMNFSLVTAFFFGFFLLVSCDKDYHAAGSELLSETGLESQSYEAPVFSYQRKVDYFQTDGLPLAQLGRIEIPGLGTTEASITAKLTSAIDPVFGNFSQQSEIDGDASNPAVINENETITNVYLEIPFFNNRDDKDADGVIDALDVDPEDRDSDTDGDGVSDYSETTANLNPLSQDSDGDGILDSVDLDNSSYEYENSTYQIDSIYGNRESSFNLKVYELKYFLSKYDPATDFEKESNYFSNTDFYERGFYGDKLHDDPVQLNFEELRFLYQYDDPATEDVDERQKIGARLTPRIRVPLDHAFFQEKILDQEGQTVFSDEESFSTHLRGLIIQTDQLSDDLYMLLDIRNAQIRIEYEYDEVDTKGTVATSDDTTSKSTDTFLLPFGLHFNTIRQEQLSPELDQEIMATQANTPSQKMYLAGNGIFSTLRLFEPDLEGRNTLDVLRENDWIINEVNMVLYVDQSVYSGLESSLLPDRLYLYKYKTGAPLTDFNIDNTANDEIRNRDKYIYGGILEKDDAGRPYRYTFKITDHVNRLIRNDSTNVELGLVPSSGINNINSKRAELMDQQFINYPSTGILNPKGVILHGHNSQTNPAGDLKLEIFYTAY